MARGRFPWLPCKLIPLLLMLLFHDVDTASCRDIKQKVGETAEFSVNGCLQVGNVITSTWNFGKDQVVVAEMDENGFITPSDNPQFKGRVEMDPDIFSLTITSLTHQDSGEYSFVSDTDTGQHPTIFITLHVYDSISKEPDVTEFAYTWHAENNSCLVSLECHATPHADNITYSWTIGNQTLEGGHNKVNVSLLAEEEDATVNCTVTNAISQQSASKTVSCKHPVSNFITGSESEQLFITAITAGTVCLLLAVALSVACYYNRRSAAGRNGSETIYATVSDSEVRSNSLEVNQNTIYESIGERINLVTVGIGSVYDRINFNRPPVASTSSIPDVCQTPKPQVTVRP